MFPKFNSKANDDVSNDGNGCAYNDHSCCQNSNAVNQKYVSIWAHYLSLTKKTGWKYESNL